MLAPSSAGIRPALPEDAPELQRLAADAFAEYDPAAARTVRGMMAHPGALTFVAEQRGTPVGFVIVEPEAHGALSISAIAVAPAQRGLRWGERLMAAAERHARARGATRLTLTTAQANVAALSLFLRVGFRIQGRSLRYAGRQPACQLSKALI